MEERMMKKFFCIFSIAALAFAACTKETVSPEDENGKTPSEGVTITFACEAPVPPIEDGSKTTVDASGLVAWEAGDSIAVWYLDSNNEPQTVPAVAASAGASTSFTCTITDGSTPTEFWAAYPNTVGELKYEDSTAKFYISLTSRTDGSFKKANIMAAYSTAEALSFAFKNAVGIVKLELPAGGVISRGGENYPITTIRLKGKETSIHSFGTVEVSQSGGVVSGFGVANGTQSVAVDLSAAVRASGVAYIPSFPGELTDGFAVRYYTRGLEVPAVLTKNTPVTVTRGNIKPLSDLTPRIVWDYYVSATGSGDGLSPSTPMSTSAFLDFLVEGYNGKNVIMCYANRLNGATFHFTPGEHMISEAITLPDQAQYSEATYYTITGDGEATLNGGGTSRIFNLTKACSRTTVRDLTLTNGASDLTGGLVSISEDAAVFVNCNFTNTSSDKNGAAIYIQNESIGKGTFNKCNFSNCSTTQSGGVLCITNPNTVANLTECTFTNNHADSNGGAYYAANGTSTLVDCVFGGAEGLGNTAGTYGGAFNASTSAAGSRLIMKGGEISYNSATGAGALFSSKANTVNLYGVTIKNNSATGGNGGALFFSTDAQKVQIDSCWILDNSCTGKGGAIYGVKPTIDIRKTTISGNNGGALRFASGDPTVRIRESVISGNTSDNHGAAIYVENLTNSGAGASKIFIDGSLIYGNTTSSASPNGYAIHVYGYQSTTLINNCTIFQPGATTLAGGNCSLVCVQGYNVIANSTLVCKNNGTRGVYSLGRHTNGTGTPCYEDGFLLNNVIVNTQNTSKAGIWVHSSYYESSDYCLISNVIQSGTALYKPLGHDVVGSTLGTLSMAWNDAGYFNAPTVPAGYTKPTKQQLEGILATATVGAEFFEFVGDSWGKDQLGNSRGTSWTPGAIQ